MLAQIEINNLMGIRDELVAGVAFGIGKRKEIPKRPRVELKNKLILTD